MLLTRVCPLSVHTLSQDKWEGKFEILILLDMCHSRSTQPFQIPKKAEIFHRLSRRPKPNSDHHNSTAKSQDREKQEGCDSEGDFSYQLNDRYFHGVPRATRPISDEYHLGLDRNQSHKPRDRRLYCGIAHCSEISWKKDLRIPSQDERCELRKRKETIMHTDWRAILR